MASTVKHKRSSVAGKIPLTTDLALGELAINTYDGKVYLKKDDGTESIVNLTEGLDTLNLLNTANGFDRQNPDSMGELSWVDATRTFTISVVSGEADYHFYVDGEVIRHTTAHSVVLPDTTGTYYIFFDETDVLQYVEQSSIVPALFYENAIVGLVYWNATSGEGLMGDERHGYRMSSATHVYNHLTFGARIELDGFDITGLTDGGSTYTQVNSGNLWDEDVLHAISLATTIPWLYRLGTTGEWTLATADNAVALDVGGSYAVWNEYTGTTWQLTEGGSQTDFYITFFVATGFEQPAEIYKIPSHNAYSTANNARDAIETEITRLKTDGLPNAEMVFLYALIVKRDGTLEELSDGSTFYDLRSAGAGSPGASNPATNAADISTDTTNFNGALSTLDTTVQTALDTLDDEVAGKATTNSLVYLKSTVYGISEFDANLVSLGSNPYNKILSGATNNSPADDGTTNLWVISTDFHLLGADMIQIAYPAVGNSSNVYIRRYTSSTWSSWTPIKGSTNLGNIPGSANINITSSSGSGTLVQGATTTLAGVLTAADKTKLDGIAIGANVTNATSVDAAGAVMRSDTTLAGADFFLDEDAFTSDSNTKVASQQSIKAYIAAQIATVGGLDTVDLATNGPYTSNDNIDWSASGYDLDDFTLIGVDYELTGLSAARSYGGTSFVSVDNILNENNYGFVGWGGNWALSAYARTSLIYDTTSKTDATVNTELSSANLQINRVFGVI